MLYYFKNDIENKKYPEQNKRRIFRIIQQKIKAKSCC